MAAILNFPSYIYVQISSAANEVYLKLCR